MTTNNTATALDNLMDQAETASREIAPVPGVTMGRDVAIPTPANNNVLAKPSMDDFLDSGGMDVDEYLRVKPEGFRIGDTMQGLLEEMIVDIDLSEVVPIYSFRCEIGGQTKFIKSYDGVTTSDAKNWDLEVQRLTRQGEKPSGVYQTFEIPFELVDDVADPKAKSTVVINAETRVGYTPSVTAAKAYKSFAKRLRNEDPALLGRTLRVKLTHEKRTKGSFEWGIINFDRVVEG
jgi:hypothetical protein